MGPAFTLPAVIAHRGDSSRAPENTLAAFRAAARAGASWVELDARLSADGRAVVCHDSTLKRIGGRPEAVHELTWAELAHIDAGAWFSPAFAGESLPSLEAALGLIGDLGLGANVELKAGIETPAVIATAAVAAIAGAWSAPAGSLLVSSYDPSLLAAVAELAPTIPRGLVLVRLVPGWRRTLARLGCVSVHVNERHLTPRAIAAVASAGVALAAWTVDDAVRAGDLWDWGVQAVFTNVPAALVAAWRARSRGA